MEPILDFFLNEGILGVLVVGGILVSIYFYKKLENCRDKRIQDHKNYTKAVSDLQEKRIAMQEKHVDNIVNTQKEVNSMINHVTSTMEALISALARGVIEDE